MNRLKALEIDFETKFSNLSYGKAATRLYMGTLRKLSKWDKLTFCFWMFLQRLKEPVSGRDNALYYFKVFFLVLFSQQHKT